MLTLKDRYIQILERIAQAAQRAGRNVEDIKLVAVSKTRPLSEILELHQLGQQHFGENRVEEAGDKIKAAGEITWHMIGHIQSRKAKEVAGNFNWVHSVESVSLAEKLNRAVAASPLTILLECNVSGEESKYGFRVESWELFCAHVEPILKLSNLRVCGLMTMAPIVEEVELTRPVFRQLRVLRDKLAVRFPSTNWNELSMGMTDDFEVAIEEGATLVRVGRAIFAP